MTHDDSAQNPGHGAATPQSGREPRVIEALAEFPPAADTPATPAEAPEPLITPLRRGPNRLLRVCAALGVVGLAAGGGFFLWNTQFPGDDPASFKSEAQTASTGAADAEKAVVALVHAQEQIAALERRLAVLEQKAPPIVPSDAIAGLERRVAALDAAAKTMSGSVAGLPAFDRRLAALETAPPKAGEAGPAPEPFVPQPPVDLAPLDAAIAASSARMGALETALGARIGAIETNLATPKTEIRATQAPAALAVRESDPAALVVVAQAIRQALERGEGFAAEIAAAENLGLDAGKLAPLQAVARDGAPTTRALAATFRAVARATLDAAQPPRTESPGLLDQLSDAAGKLVRVRPAGEAKGDDAPALAAQIEAALERGAVAPALAAWDKMPPPARKVSETWAASARQRVGADVAAQAIFHAAIAELGRKRSAQ